MVWYWESFLRVVGASSQVHQVNQFDLVPNGGRAYFLDRSQPPLLSEMVLVVANATGNVSLIEQALPALEKEYTFWMQRGADGRAVAVPDPDGHNGAEDGGQQVFLNRYNVHVEYPRPESFEEDVDTVRFFGCSLVFLFAWAHLPDGTFFSRFLVHPSAGSWSGAGSLWPRRTPFVRGDCNHGGDWMGFLHAMAVEQELPCIRAPFSDPSGGSKHDYVSDGTKFGDILRAGLWSRPCVGSELCGRRGTTSPRHSPVPLAT